MCNTWEIVGLSFNPLATIPNQHKLTGSNYVNWKRNLDIVLIAEGYKYVLNTECPVVLDADAFKKDKEEYDKWIKADEMEWCYMLGAMSNALQHQH